MKIKGLKANKSFVVRLSGVTYVLSEGEEVPPMPSGMAKDFIKAGYVRRKRKPARSRINKGE